MGVIKKNNNLPITVEYEMGTIKCRIYQDLTYITKRFTKNKLGQFFSAVKEKLD